MIPWFASLPFSISLVWSLCTEFCNCHIIQYNEVWNCWENQSSVILPVMCTFTSFKHLCYLIRNYETHTAASTMLIQCNYSLLKHVGCDLWLSGVYSTIIIIHAIYQSTHINVTFIGLLIQFVCPELTKVNQKKNWLKNHLSTITTIFMRQFEDTCHHSKH